jgi:hypothetical protein
MGNWDFIGHSLTRGTYRDRVTLRQRLDQLSAEAPVGDLGYSADQRLVASAWLGLQLFADEIDQMKGVSAGPVPPKDDEAQAPVKEAPDDVASVDIDVRLAELTEQLRKLTKAVKKSTKKK